jgi:ABC-2 type transport system ATP-binding protein
VSGPGRGLRRSIRRPDPGAARRRDEVARDAAPADAASVASPADAPVRDGRPEGRRRSLSGDASQREASGGRIRTEPPIRTRGLTKRYGELTAVDNLDLEVRVGEIFGLLGANGAGKTTPILMLLGLTERTSGAVRVVGFDPARQPLEVKRRVGYLPDTVGFYEDMTGRENLRFTARLNGLKGQDAESRIATVLDQVRLTDRADDRAGTYSRGMLQRLGIADALVKDPTVLILDEPTASIDPIGVVEILDLLRGLVRDRGVTILLSSHLLTQVQSVCDRVGIFAAGKLVGIGTVPELAARFAEGESHIEVGFEGAEADGGARIRSVLAAIPDVSEVRRGAHVTDPWTLVVRAPDAVGRVRDAVLVASARESLHLTSIRAVTVSLDEIYATAVRAAGLSSASHPAAPSRPASGGRAVA